VDNKTKLSDLYLTFAKIGLMTFGGGLAMLPIIEKEVVDNKKWETSEALYDYYAVSQCTPGVIAINVATFVGYNKRKTIGGIIASLGVITPSVIIILLIATTLMQIQNYPLVQSALKGIGIGISAILITTIYKLGKNSVKSILGIILTIISFILCYFLKVSVVWIVLGGIVLGILKARLEVNKKWFT